MDEDVKSERAKDDSGSREVTSGKREGIQVFNARPLKGPIDYKAIRDRIHQRFSKTIAYLAK